MSITITYSTMDHRYFMRRTRSEIISRIEELTGQRFDSIERLRMESMHKAELATIAANAVRALPEPPDPVDVVTQVIRTEFVRQRDGNWVNVDDPDVLALDGSFNLRELAAAVIKSGALDR